MTQNVYDVVKDYVIKNSNLSFTEIADLILENKASTLSHRTLRQYASDIYSELGKQRSDSELLGNDTESDFVDLSPNTNSLVTTKVLRVPKILLLDIETARMHVGAWQLGKQYITSDQIVKDWFILGFSCKWLYDSKTISHFVTAKKALDRDDKQVCSVLWDYINDADVIITHNGVKFDLPKINTKFIVNGFLPPSPYLNIDTYRVASKQFGFTANSLNYLSKLLISKEKIHTNYNLWIRCENGDDKALDDMRKYCVSDTQLLEEVYVELRPWIKNHPNIGVLMESEVKRCPNCGSEHVEETEYYYTTQQNRYVSVVCNNCGAFNRLSKSVLSADERKASVIPAAH